jgi:hypothetical protein
MVFSDITTNLGIAQQSRALVRLDSTQFTNTRIANSCNNYLDKVAGYAIGADKRFQWDDSNHTALPIGTTNLISGQTDYSFLTDEQGNRILTLTRIEVKDSTGFWRKLEVVDQSQIGIALDEASRVTGIPTSYDKIADNIIRLYPTPNLSVTAGIKFYFQRTPSYFTASDTTKEPGVPSLLHRGFVVSSAYDVAIALGLSNTQVLSVEMEKEEKKMQEYFLNRNNDEVLKIIPIRRNTK